MAVLRHALPAGTRLRDFEIVGVLGAGGFGVTYLARDLKLDSLRAIKEFYPRELVEREPDLAVTVRSEDERPSYDAGLRSFLNEARIGASLNHPNIAQVLAFFEANGTGYVVMPYYEGSTLQQRLQSASTPSSREEVLEVILPILDALEYVHGRGLIHRDIKPANIYLRQTGAPLLIDFGAARLASRGTRPLTAILTPGFAPPEQYLPDAPQGAFTDLYAIGAVMYRMISGHEPKDAYSRSVGGLAGDPMVPVTRLAQGRCQQGFLAAIDRCLRLNATARFATVAELRAALLGESLPLTPGEGAETRQPPAAAAVSAPDLPAKAAAPGRRWPLGLAALAVVGLGAVLAWRFWPASVIAPKPASPAVSGLAPGSLFRDPLTAGGQGPEMVVLPAGKFHMGSIRLELDRDPAEGPQHERTVASIALARHELSQAEFAAFVTATGHVTDAERDRRAGAAEGSATEGCVVALVGGFDWLRNTSWRQPMRPVQPTEPVVCISFDDAVAYVAWLSESSGQRYRLPSEAEFEYALRGGVPAISFPWPEAQKAQFCEYSNLDASQTAGYLETSCSDAYAGIAPVAALRPNGYGLHDLSGNVAEWTADCWNPGYAGTPTDGQPWLKGDCQRRVVRGASFDDGWVQARVAARASQPAGYRSVLIGMRVAREL